MPRNPFEQITSIPSEESFDYDNTESSKKTTDNKKPEIESIKESKQQKSDSSDSSGDSDQEAPMSQSAKSKRTTRKSYEKEVNCSFAQNAQTDPKNQQGQNDLSFTDAVRNNEDQKNSAQNPQQQIEEMEPDNPNDESGWTVDESYQNQEKQVAYKEKQTKKSTASKQQDDEMIFPERKNRGNRHRGSEGDFKKKPSYYESDSARRDFETDEQNSKHKTGNYRQKQSSEGEGHSDYSNKPKYGDWPSNRGNNYTGRNNRGRGGRGGNRGYGGRESYNGGYRRNDRNQNGYSTSNRYNTEYEERQKRPSSPTVIEKIVEKQVIKQVEVIKYKERHRPQGRIAHPIMSIYIKGCSLNMSCRRLESYSEIQSIDILVIPYLTTKLELYPGEFVNSCEVNYKKKISDKGSQLSKAGSIYLQKFVSKEEDKKKIKTFAFLKIDIQKVLESLKSGIQELFVKLKTIINGDQKYTFSTMLFPLLKDNISSVSTKDSSKTIVQGLIEELQDFSPMRDVFLTTEKHSQFSEGIKGFNEVMGTLFEENEINIS